MGQQKKLIVSLKKKKLFGDDEGQTVLFPEKPPVIGPYDPPSSDMPFWPAPEVAEVLDQMKSLYHRQLCVEGVEFHCLFAAKPIRIRGADAAATIEPVSGASLFKWQYAQHLALSAKTPDGSPGREAKRDFTKDPIVPVPIFIIKVWNLWWAEAEEWERMALCDHELCHAVIHVNDDTGVRTAGTVGHDVEEFHNIVKRWGAWNRGLAALVAEHRNGKMMRQASGVKEYD